MKSATVFSTEELTIGLLRIRFLLDSAFIAPHMRGQILRERKPLSADPALRHLIPVFRADMSFHLLEVSTTLTAMLATDSQRLSANLFDLKSVRERGPVGLRDFLGLELEPTDSAVVLSPDLRVGQKAMSV